MRDQAARCGFRGYAALPVFDSHTNQRYGVLEILLNDTYLPLIYLFTKFDEKLQIEGLRVTTNPVSTTSGSPPKMQLESEIKEILELIVETIPGLYLAQVWVPCYRCVKKSADLGCMGMAYPIISTWIREHNPYDVNVENYLDACQCHNLRLDLGSFNSLNSYDVSISEYPLAHYAHKARFTHSFSISLESLDNSKHFCLVQFFHQPKFRQDAYGDNSLRLLLKIMEMNLKRFKFVLRGQLLEESQRPYAIQHGSIKSLKEMESYKQKFSESKFKSYLKIDSYYHRPSSEYSDDSDSEEWWVVCSPADGNIVHMPVKKKIRTFMKNIEEGYDWEEEYRIIQFWVPKMDGNRCYLETSDQPYAVSCLAKGLASFRRKCTTHHYIVDEEAKEEELGPPGRVFKSGHPEITPDLFLYTTKEFPIGNYAKLCCGRAYLAIPIFDDQHDHKCVGVLEFIGFPYDQFTYVLGQQLKAAKLCSAHIDFHTRFLGNEPHVHSLYLRKETPNEVKGVLRQMCDDIPQLRMANVWVPTRECGRSTHSNMSYMELVFSTDKTFKSIFTNEVYWIKVQAKKGMIGMVLASENNSCFCHNLCEFGIADQPLSHFEMSVRCDVCFAIFLQSSHTDELYVVEFFLYPGPPSYEYLRSFLNFLLPMMKNKLTSFKMACGKELGEELVIEVIEFSEANKLVSSESEQPDVFPVKFKSVQYSQSGRLHTEEQQPEEHIVAASDSEITERRNRKTSLHLNLEALEPHFGKKLNDVAKELGVGRSTIKRACRGYGIDRWPSTQKQKRNLSLVERERSGDSQHATVPSTSNVTHANAEGAEKVMIKVKHGEDIIKFELCLSLGLDKVMEEIGTTLDLEMGTFKLKYFDEDDDEILLKSDDCLLLCRNSHIAMGKTFIQLCVRL